MHYIKCNAYFSICFAVWLINIVIFRRNDLKKYSEEKVKIDDLILDENNPRFAELYNGNTEQDLIEYLLYNEGAKEIAEEIYEEGDFYSDKPLWVMISETQKGKFNVFDGNRRCAAVKALLHPNKYGLDFDKIEIQELPVLIYNDINVLRNRIRKEHTSSSFKEWSRIAKALEVYKMHKDGMVYDNLKEYDSDPSALIKLASFYYAAVNIAGNDLKKLFKQGRGENKGRAVIFERLFDSVTTNTYGYHFEKKPSCQIKITNEQSFKNYIRAMVNILTSDKDITSRTIDDDKHAFLQRINAYICDISEKNTSTTDNKQTNNTKTSDNNKSSEQASSSKNDTPNKGSNTKPSNKKGSVKTRPNVQRKNCNPAVILMMNELYNIPKDYPNAIIALSRAVLECVMKYVVEETKYNTKLLKDTNHFQKIYSKKVYCDELKNKLAEVIKNNKQRQALTQFDLDKLHAVMHNPDVIADYAVAQVQRTTLIPIIEFLLQDENDLFNELDVSKFS